MSVVGEWSDRQHLADRLDSVLLRVTVDDCHHHFVGGRVPTSEIPNVLRRILLARRSLRLSHCSAVRPDRLTCLSFRLPDPFPQRPRRPADLRRDRLDRRPLRVVLHLIPEHHPNDPAVYAGGLPPHLVHDSIPLQIGVSDNPRAAQSFDRSYVQRCLPQQGSKDGTWPDTPPNLSTPANGGNLAMISVLHHDDQIKRSQRCPLM